MFDLSKRVAVVTGASSGLGKQMALALAGQGADLVIMARRMERLEALKVEIEALGVKCLPLCCDITDSQQVDAAAAAAEAEYGKIDILVNCAGAVKSGGVLDTTDEDWAFTVDADLTSTFYMTRAFGNIMKKNNYGRIINIASIYGMIAKFGGTSIGYPAAKGGVVNFTRAVAQELAKYNITCNSICPGFFPTEINTAALASESHMQFMKNMVPMGRYGRDGELNAAAIFFASDEASYVTGVILPVDGGYTAI